MKNFFTALIFLFFLNNCGYKVVKKSELSNFRILEINAAGEKRVNYHIKNKLMFGSNDKSNNLISIDLKSSKLKSIKEKNIKNEITKYSLVISTDVNFKYIEKAYSEKFQIVKKGDFNVSERHTQTMNNEKKIIDLLTNELAENIFDELIMRMNDL